MSRFSSGLFQSVDSPSKMTHEIDGGLVWAALCAAVEDEHKYKWKDYWIQRHRSLTALNGTAFMAFSRHHVGLRRDPDCGPKLHVGLNVEQSENINSDIQVAFNGILRVLMAHQIEFFKVILASKLNEFIASGQYGKIFTIYLGERSEAEYWQIAHDIEAVIKNARQYPPIKPCDLRATDCEARCDTAIPGCDFVTYASDRSERARYKASDSAAVSRKSSTLSSDSLLLSDEDRRRLTL